ncbi:hypothetical protein CH63R_00267 [Colletotrichum higginsianum IMI 349063]|uniref:Uncharacterized protein n=1 Tax=Colletotrichum higginsianum (strain IMI 349063) TaxID=759273 RepID=A0A1B7YST3_COLHI|nr:hypothetical protein CH63R_00267 [Colletotrichum higginsianum IMI 349063]OBR15087.1 hypothetical protein CH63R_00267 [Colletotrichum higginsianum IMI 349063]
MNGFTGVKNEGTMQDTILCTSVWPSTSYELFGPEQYATLAAYARREIAASSRSHSQVPPETEHMKELRRIMTHVQESTHKPFEMVTEELLRNSLPSGGNQINQVSAILCVAASLSTMTRIRPHGVTDMEPETTTIWRTHCSLNTIITQLFETTSSTEPSCRPISPKLTIGLLAQYHNCRVVWTDRLDKHLSIQKHRGDRIVLIFQHKIWLSAHLGQNERCLVPSELICETLDTLNLLFPHNDQQTKSFLHKQGQKFYSLGYCGRDRKLNLSDYPHWGNKIEELLDMLEGPRSGIWHFLPRPDKRNLLESANFWIATAAALLAFVGFVLGLMSIVYAKWSYDISRESLVVSRDSLELTRIQYLLSLAQACSDANEARLLPDFCSAEE